MVARVLAVEHNIQDEIGRVTRSSEETSTLAGFIDGAFVCLEPLLADLRLRVVGVSGGLVDVLSDEVDDWHLHMQHLGRLFL